ncbi:hypothetical protein FSPOR_1245 [Fusarium sporotrichioides]|uniref:F-box domain-containing protein n=1 Tax=Fusarium sporotrichioides TaxID=5514 RepID=A0A395SR66_FUSSP|nr:hypothetical protein FSPOR_1245 [Fusarium sporotrichioides]
MANIAYYIDIFEVRLVNKRFCKIATPLRVRHWSDRGYYGPYNTSLSRTTINRLALELLRYPELRLQVRILEIDWFRTDHGNGTPRHLIRPENLDLLARAAEETLPDLASSTDLCEQIRQGWDDGIAVLVLSWTRNLTNLSLTIPSHITAKDENGYPLLVLHFAKKVALRFAFDDSKSALPLPLEKLHTLNIQSLVEHASSLEEVTLFIEDIDEGHWTPDSADTDELPECWRAFRKLKRAGIPMQHLLQMEDVNDPTTAKLNPGRLPESLEHLTIFHHQLHDMLLEETRPTGHLKKLKTIDFSDALLDDPIAEEIRIVKNLAKERGVEFFLGRTKR